MIFESNRFVKELLFLNLLYFSLLSYVFFQLVTMSECQPKVPTWNKCHVQGFNMGTTARSDVSGFP